MTKTTQQKLKELIQSTTPKVEELLDEKTSDSIDIFLERILWCLSTIDSEIDYESWHDSIKQKEN
jgi:hypothetical protein